MWIECSPERPWGVHPRLHNDDACHRCGWTAPGPLSAARNLAEDVAAAEAMAHANELGWRILDGGRQLGEAEALGA
jgi:hypothetical protein